MSKLEIELNQKIAKIIESKNFPINTWSADVKSLLKELGLHPVFVRKIESYSQYIINFNGTFMKVEFYTHSDFHYGAQYTLAQKLKKTGFNFIEIEESDSGYDEEEDCFYRYKKGRIVKYINARKS